MTGDPLRELLREADAAAGPPPPLPDDLPQRVHRLGRRRRRVRIGLTATAATLLLIVAASVLLSLLSAPSPSPHDGIAIKEPKVDVAALRAEIDRLRGEVAWWTAVVEKMLELETDESLRHKLRKHLARPSTAELRAREVEKAAFIIVYDGDQKLQQPGGQDAAAATYRQALRLFPQTKWAKAAQEKLETIQKL